MADHDESIKLLKNRSAIITGAANGLGRATAFAFAKNGAKMTLADIDIDGARVVAENIRLSGGDAIAVRADVTNREDVHAMVASSLKEYGKIDILVNVAGGLFPFDAKPSYFVDSNVDDWEKLLDLNLKSVLLCCGAVLKHMISNRSGAIVNTSSIAGIDGQDGLIVYSAAKAGVIAFTKGLAKEVSNYGLRVNGIAPGVMKTRVHKEEMLPILTASVPLGRLGEPDEFAQTAVFLASDKASYISGHTIVMSGGLAGAPKSLGHSAPSQHQ